MDYSNRHKTTVQGVRLPKVYVPEDRGLNECCCSFMVFASPDTEPYKNQKSSAWIAKADFIDFLLTLPDGSTITLPDTEFPNQQDAYYATVDWYTMLGLYGPGCYTLTLDYTVAGISDSFVWAKYDLVEYSLARLNHHVALKTTFNSLQTIEGIDFTGSNVVDCLTFPGWFGDRKPNMVVENLTYSTRESRKIHRENLNAYELTAQTVTECISNKLLDLHLLSENDIKVSDFNAMNHSYKYLDFPAIVEKSPEVSYRTRKATIKCEMGDKYKNNRSKYGF